MSTNSNTNNSSSSKPNEALSAKIREILKDFRPSTRLAHVNELDESVAAIITAFEPLEQEAWKEGYDQGYNDAKNGN